MKYTPYGTDMTYDYKTRENYTPTRIKMANNGYGLNRLVDDPEYRVRVAVAKWFSNPQAELDMDILNKLAKDKNPSVRLEVAESCHASPELLEQLINDNYVGVKCAVARQGYKLDVLYKDALEHDEFAVLEEIAKQGYMADELINYRNNKFPDICAANVNDAAKEYFDNHRLAKYGSNEMLDKLADSESVEVRQAVAETGYGLDKLINDPDWRVRKAVAEHEGFGWYKLINDPDWHVRKECAEQGYGLDSLVYDEKSEVREAVAEIGYDKHLDILVNDEDKDVIIAVLQNGREQDCALLANDPSGDIRAAVAYSTTNESIAKQFVNDEYWYVRCQLAKSGKCLNELVNDPVPAVRQSVALACNGNKDILTELSHDTSEMVSGTAFHQMREYGLTEKANWSKVEASLDKL